jgi:hypothetical protein
MKVEIKELEDEMTQLQLDAEASYRGRHQSTMGKA